MFKLSTATLPQPDSDIIKYLCGDCLVCAQHLISPEEHSILKYSSNRCNNHMNSFAGRSLLWTCCRRLLEASYLNWKPGFRSVHVFMLSVFLTTTLWGVVLHATECCTFFFYSSFTCLFSTSDIVFITKTRVRMILYDINQWLEWDLLS